MVSLLEPGFLFTQQALLIYFRAAFEIVALAAGRLGSLPLAAQSVIMTTDQSNFVYPRSFSSY